MITIAKVGAPHGVRGALKLHILLENHSLPMDTSEWFLRFPGKTWQPCGDTTCWQQGAHYLIQFAACQDRDRAKRFTHAEIGIKREFLSEPEQDEFYWADLEGLQVINQQDITLGNVAYLLATGANDVLVVQGDRERLIPFIDDVVLSVDQDQGKIMVDWDEAF